MEDKANREQYSSNIYCQFEDAVETDGTINFLDSVKMFGTIVDVGSGASWYRELIVGDANKYIAIEPNDHMRSVAVKNSEEDEKNRDRCFFYKGIAQHLPLENHLADVVMATYSLNEVGDSNKSRRIAELKKALNEIRRVAKPNAMLIFVEQTGGEQDDWYNLLDAGCLGRGERPCREIADVWIEIFSFLNQYASIERIERLNYSYRFENMEKAMNLSQALVPDIAFNDKVAQHVKEFYNNQPRLVMEALGIVAYLK